MSLFWAANTLKLIELLKEHPYIWDEGNSQYRKKAVREYGFATIANELNVTVSTVKHKVTNLKCKYKGEMRKIKSAKQSGFFYKPLLSWFNDFQELMESGEAPRESIPLLSEVNVLSNPSRENMAELEEDEEDSGEEPDTIEEADNSDTIVVSISQEYIDEVNKAQKNINAAPKSFKKSVNPTTRKRVKEPTDSVIQDYSDNMIEVSEEPRRDEFQMFAEQIAEQLKMMPIESAMSIQTAIQSMLDEVCNTE